jgi:hypothetical protein
LSNHPVTRAGKPTEVLVVGAGKLLVYVYDLPAARAAVNCVPAGRSARAVAAGSEDEDEALAPTILLRFDRHTTRGTSGGFDRQTAPVAGGFPQQEMTPTQLTGVQTFSGRWSAQPPDSRGVRFPVTTTSAEPGAVQCPRPL